MAEAGFGRSVLLSLIGAILAAVVALGFAFVHNWLGITPSGERIRPPDNGTAEKDREGTKPAARRAFKDPPEVLAVLADDLNKADPAVRPTRRYLTLVHLNNNRAVSDAELEQARGMVGEIVQFLAPAGRVPACRPIDPERTLFAIDLKDLGWSPQDEWARVLKGYPYGLRPPEDGAPAWKEAGRAVETLADSELASVRGDWFAVTALRLASELKVPADRTIPESLKKHAREYPNQVLTLDGAAAELPRNEPTRLANLLSDNTELRDRTGLKPLSQGGTISRTTWESTENTTSPFQEVSEALDLGKPLVRQ
jgi:hypothetical protein